MSEHLRDTDSPPARQLLIGKDVSRRQNVTQLPTAARHSPIILSNSYRMKRVLELALVTLLAYIIVYIAPTLLKSQSIRASHKISNTNMSFTGAPRKIAKVVKSIEQSEGAGARVRRSIGTPQLKNYSPFLMLDHFKVPKGAGFPE